MFVPTIATDTELDDAVDALQHIDICLHAEEGALCSYCACSPWSFETWDCIRSTYH